VSSSATRLRDAGSPADVVPLGIVDAELPQPGDGRPVADELGDRLGSEPVRQRHDRLDHELVGRRGAEVADELAVDLEVVEVEELEVGEGREPGAEVVDRQLAAEPPEPHGQSPGAVDVPNRGGLGDLEHQAAGGDLGLREQLGEMVGEPGVAHRPPGDVDAEHQVLAGGVAVVEALDCLLEHPVVDLPDQAGFLGIEQERGRRDEVAVAVGEADQELEDGRTARDDRGDRLGVEHEAVIPDRPPEAFVPALAARHQAVRPGTAVVDGTAVLAGALGLVHRDVGLDDQLVWSEDVVLAEHGYPDRAREMGPVIAVLGRRVAPERREQLLGDDQRRRPVAAVEQDRELVAADPGERVGPADGGVQQPTDTRDQLVAGCVAERVVDELEAIEVEEEDGSRLVVSGRELERSLQLLAEASAVEQAGEGVVVCEVLELALGPLAVGDVHDVGDRERLPVVALREEGAADENPDGVPVAVDQALLELDVVAPPVGQLAELDGRRGPILRVGQGGERRADQLVEGPPEDGGERGVDLEQAGGLAGAERDQADPDRGSIERRVEALLSGAHGVLHADPVGDVAGDRRSAEESAVGVVDERDPQGHVELPPVLGDADGFERLDPLAAPELGEDPRVLVAALGWDEHPDRATDRLCGRVPEELLGCAVPALDLAVE